ncbi:MAG: response regulator [Sedimentibacter sp.]|jgi:response regulator of citrate/malate metabolism|nr:response regulator [Sedimentibacter sp.]
MINVMIIEDDPMVRDINSKFLKKIDDFKLVKAASNLTEAMEFMNDNKVDLLLLDIYLPKENGIEFLKKLRKEGAEVDVILITADKTSIMIQEALRYGAVDYLIKPFTLERFKEALGKYKQMYNSFSNSNTIEQKTLDKYIAGSSSSEKSNDEEDFEKGINKYTYKIIWSEMESSKDNYKTAEEISASSGVARVTVRKYLDYMEKEDKVKKIIEYGKVGRPQHKYKIKTK